MSPVLNVLNGLASVLESAACNYTGEAKGELNYLCKNLESDPGFEIEGKEEILAKCRQALKLYYAMRHHEGSGILSQISRELWQTISR